MKQWINSWGYRETDFSLFPIEVENETQRICFLNNLSAEKIRLRFSNRYSREGYAIEEVRISCSDESGTIIQDSQVAVTFDGQKKLHLNPREVRYSDEIEFRAMPGQWIAITTYIKEKARIRTAISSQSLVVSRCFFSTKGNLIGERVLPSEKYLGDREFLTVKPDHCFVGYGISQVEMLTEEKVTQICIFGDSICQHGHFSNVIAKRLYDKYPGTVSMTNRGICGNRVLHDASVRSVFGFYFGEAAFYRFEEDVFETGSPADVVLIHMGVNDIMHPTEKLAPQYEVVSAEEIEKGLARLIAMARKRNIRVLGASILPFNGHFPAWTPENEVKRVAINKWLKESADLDAYLDLEVSVRDKDDHTKLIAEYDCGDHIHPNVKGGAVIGNDVDLSVFGIGNI